MPAPSWLNLLHADEWLPPTCCVAHTAHACPPLLPHAPAPAAAHTHPARAGWVRALAVSMGVWWWWCGFGWMCVGVQAGPVAPASGSRLLLCVSVCVYGGSRMHRRHRAPTWLPPLHHARLPRTHPAPRLPGMAHQPPLRPPLHSLRLVHAPRQYKQIHMPCLRKLSPPPPRELTPPTQPPPLPSPPTLPPPVYSFPAAYILSWHLLVQIRSQRPPPLAQLLQHLVSALCLRLLLLSAGPVAGRTSCMCYELLLPAVSVPAAGSGRWWWCFASRLCDAAIKRAGTKHACATQGKGEERA